MTGLRADHSSAGSASSTTASLSPDGTTPSSVNPTLGDGRSCACAGPASPCTQTCERSIALRLASIFSSEASPAAAQARPAAERASTIHRLRSGGRWPESLASFDPDSSSSKTSQICSPWREPHPSLLEPRGEKYSESWPRSAMSCRGNVYPLPPLAPRTFVIGSSALLPSPMARVNSGSEVTGKNRTGGPMLKETLTSLLPTPSATEYGNNQSPSPNAKVRPSLAGVLRLLPTPVQQDGKNATAPSQDNRNSPPMGSVLRNLKLLPTPTRTDPSQIECESEQNNPNRKLPVELVSLSIGPSTDPQSSDGKPSSEGLLENPSFREWLMGLPEGWSDPNCLLSATAFSCRPASSSEPV